MFTKLRNKFLILNMSTTSILMFAAFIIIYLITYNNIYKENQNKLSSKNNAQISIAAPYLPTDIKDKAIITKNFLFSDSLLFNIQVDADGNILSINSFINLPEETYYKAAETAWHDKKNNSTITLDGRQWEYSITQINKQIVLENGQQYATSQDNYLITFLDVTESNRTLFQLLTTLILVGLIMLFAVFIISLYFANKAIKPISETWEKQKQFVADASHELKTPLSIINANYDALLANREETIESQLKWLGYIKIGTDRMTKLIHDLLSLAKIEDVHLEIKKTPFNISADINDVILSMESIVLEKGIRLSHRIEPDIIVESDSERIKQVVTILFDNAIKYTNENGQIDISLIKSKRQVVYSITNSGKGIAKEDLLKVFDRFYRSDPSRAQETGGYGLGLSIAKTIINRLGGDIQATSTENEFTTFTFTLRL